MTTAAEGIAELEAVVARAERQLAGITGNELGDLREREWLEGQITEMRARIATYKSLTGRR